MYGCVSKFNLNNAIEGVTALNFLLFKEIFSLMWLISSFPHCATGTKGGTRRHKRCKLQTFVTDVCVCVCVCVCTLYLLKGIVHPKMKILSSFTQPQVVPNLYECVCSEHKGRYFLY